MQPIREVNIYMFLYFVVFIVIGVFICANLIVGILVKQTLIAGPLSDLFPSSTKPAKSKPDHDNLISDNDENSPDETVRKCNKIFVKQMYNSLLSTGSIKTGRFCSHKAIRMDCFCRLFNFHCEFVI